MVEIKKTLEEETARKLEVGSRSSRKAGSDVKGWVKVGEKEV